MGIEIERKRYSHERLNAMIEAQGVRVDWLAEQIGVDSSYITKLRYGDRDLTDDLVVRFARLFRVPMSYFEATPVESQVA